MNTVVLALLVAQAMTIVLAAPHVQQYKQDPYVSVETTPCKNETNGLGEVYDQRQNGTENYRINVNGVVVLLAPAETILAAASLPNMDDSLVPLKPPKPVTTVHPVQLENTVSQGVTPTMDPCAGGKCIIPVVNSTVKQRGTLRMMNNLLHLLRNFKDDSQIPLH